MRWSPIHLFSALCLMLIAGCTTLPEKAGRDISASTSEAVQAIEGMRARSEAPLIRRHDTPWLAFNKRARRPQALPSVLDRPFNINKPEPLTIHEVALEIARGIDLPVRVSADVDDDEEEGSGPGARGGIRGGPFALGGDDESDEERHVIRESGQLSDVLDRVAQRFKISWKYEDGAIWFHRFETKVLSLSVFSGSGSFISGIGGEAATSDTSDDGGSNSSKSETFQSASMESEINSFESVKQAIERMLSSKGKLAMAPASGTVVVTDYPANVRRIAAFVERENNEAIRQISLEVKVLSITANDSDGYGLNLQALFESANITASLGGVAGLSSDPNSLTLTLNRGRFKGSEGVVQALSEVTNVNVVTSAVATTLNNQPVPLQVSREDGYLESVSVTQVEGSAMSALTPGKVTTGFLMTARPRILQDDRIMLHYALDLSSLENWNVEESGDQKITTPEVQRRAFTQQAVLRSGQILALSGFEQASSSVNERGMGRDRGRPLWFLGGSRQASKQRTMIVILITPVLMDNRL